MASGDGERHRLKISLNNDNVELKGRTMSPTQLKRVGGEGKRGRGGRESREHEGGSGGGGCGESLAPHVRSTV